MKKLIILQCTDAACNTEDLKWRDGTQFVHDGTYKADMTTITGSKCVGFELDGATNSDSVLKSMDCSSLMPYVCEIPDCGPDPGRVKTHNAS